MDEFLKSHTGKILISIIWGLGIAALFRNVCKGTDCIVIKGPNPNEIKQNIYKIPINDKGQYKCVRFIPYYSSCIQ